tara:strand:+ start:203 stop:784 length:582 start_codon:yes stop_codon:yes gene_type:complete
MIESEEIENKDKEIPEEESNRNSDDNKENLSTEEKLKVTEEKLLRSLAEIENQRRRFEKEIKEAFDFGGYNFAKECLLLLDNLQRARDYMFKDNELKDSKYQEKYLKNLDILKNDLISVFEKNKIKKIECLNQKFDPNFHQAMLEVEDDNVEVGTIVQEIQTGYMMGERLLRPSLVGVSKLKSKEKEPKNDEK